MEQRGRSLTITEQKKIVSKTNTAGIPQNVGFPGFNLNNKPKKPIIKNSRKRG